MSQEAQQKLTTEKCAIAEIGLLGGVLGAGQAPAGHRTEGWGRGARRGLHTGLGMGLGGLLGAGVGFATGDQTDSRTSLNRMLTGSMAGVGLGGLTGYGLSGATIPEPTWKSDNPEEGMDPAVRDDLATYGSIVPGLAASALGGAAANSLSLGTGGQIAGMLGAGVPTAVLVHMLMQKHLPVKRRDNRKDTEQQKAAGAKTASRMSNHTQGGGSVPHVKVIASKVVTGKPGHCNMSSVLSPDDRGTTGLSTFGGNKQVAPSSTDMAAGHDKLGSLHPLLQRTLQKASESKTVSLGKPSGTPSSPMQTSSAGVSKTVQPSARRVKTRYRGTFKKRASVKDLLTAAMIYGRHDHFEIVR